jgi:hypothetical protein
MCLGLGKHAALRQGLTLMHAAGPLSAQAHTGYSGARKAQTCICLVFSLSGRESGIMWKPVSSSYSMCYHSPCAGAAYYCQVCCSSPTSMLSRRACVSSKEACCRTGADQASRRNVRIKAHSGSLTLPKRAAWAITGIAVGRLARRLVGQSGSTLSHWTHQPGSSA